MIWIYGLYCSSFSAIHIVAGIVTEDDNRESLQQIAT